MSISILSQNGQMVRKPTLTAAFTDADTAGKTVVITGPVTAGTMTTGGRSLEIKQGGLINVPDGETFTINGPFSCGLFQCFDCVETGKVVFGSGSVTEVYPEWWGAKADGTGDSSQAINSAIIAHNFVRLQAGTYRTTAAINMKAFTGLHGAGRGLTVVQPVGAFTYCIGAIGSSQYAGRFDGIQISGLSVSGAGFTGIGLKLLYVGLKSDINNLYIHSVTGIGMYIEGSFDHIYKSIEIRSCTGYGLHVYEKQTVFDGIYEEVSQLIFDHIHVLSCNNAGTQIRLDGGDSITFRDCKAGEGAIGLHISRNCSAIWIDRWFTDGVGTATNAIQIDADFAYNIQLNDIRAYQCAAAVAANRGRSIYVGKISSISNGGSASNDVVVGALFDGDIIYQYGSGAIIDSSTKLGTIPAYYGWSNNGTRIVGSNTKIVTMKKTFSVTAGGGAVQLNIPLPRGMTTIHSMSATPNNANLVQSSDTGWYPLLANIAIRDATSMDVTLRLTANTNFMTTATYDVYIIVIGV